MDCKKMEDGDGGWRSLTQSKKNNLDHPKEKFLLTQLFLEPVLWNMPITTDMTAETGATMSIHSFILKQDIAHTEHLYLPDLHLVVKDTLVQETNLAPSL